MADVQTMIGPANAGQCMSLDEFAQVEGEPGHLYELAKGVIVVVDVPGLPHGRIVDAIRDQLAVYRTAHPRVIDYIADGMEACIRLPGMASERHPDLSIYLTPPPTDDPQPWDRWTPSIVIEVISAGSEDRDLRDKRDEYLAAGVNEYWIVEPASTRMLVLRRRGDLWTELTRTPEATYTTGLLPGFKLELTQVFHG